MWVTYTQYQSLYYDIFLPIVLHFFEFLLSFQLAFSNYHLLSILTELIGQLTKINQTKSENDGTCHRGVVDIVYTWHTLPLAKKTATYFLSLSLATIILRIPYNLSMHMTPAPFRILAPAGNATKSLHSPSQFF